MSHIHHVMDHGQSHVTALTYTFRRVGTQHIINDYYKPPIKMVPPAMGSVPLDYNNYDMIL